MSRSGGNAYSFQYDGEGDEGLLGPDDDETQFHGGKQEWDNSFEEMAAMSPASDVAVVEETYDPQKIRPFWDKFPKDVNYYEVPVLDDVRSVHAKPEVDELLRSVFKDAVESDVPMGGMPEWVHKNFNLTLKITRVQNLITAKLMDTFRESYNLEAPIMLLHGTCAAAAKTIARNGPTPGVGIRNLWGKGFYATPLFGYAFMYAIVNLLEDGTQIILILDFLAGNTIIGSEDLVNFGYTIDDQPIFTATDDSSPPKIYVGTNSCQFSVRYIITVKLDRFTPLSHLHHQTMFACGGGYQQAVKAFAATGFGSMGPLYSIKPPSGAAVGALPVAGMAGAASAALPLVATAGAASAALPLVGIAGATFAPGGMAVFKANLAAAAVAKAAILATVYQPVRVQHDGKGIREGDRVKIVKSAKNCLNFTIGKYGEVMMVVTLYSQPTLYLLKLFGLTNDEISILLRANKGKCAYEGDDQIWLRCKIKEIELDVAAAVVIPSTSSGASGSTVQAATSGTASITINTSNSGASVNITSNGAGATASASVVPQQSAAVVGERTRGKRPMDDDMQKHKKHQP